MVAVDLLEPNALPEAGAPGDPVVGLSDWLIQQAFDEVEMPEMFQGVCDRLRLAGVPVSRGYLGFRTLHPLFAAVSLLWRTGATVSVAEHPHGTGRASRQWRDSPFAYLLKTRQPMLRRRLVGREAKLDFPILPELRDQGLTDYLAFVALRGGSDREEIVGSWAADRKGGFRKQELEVLRRVQRWLAVACKLSVQTQIARNALSTYLGPTAAERVLAGQIRRGDGRSIYAAIFYSDLRNSTELGSAMEEREFLELLNGYFECAGGAILEQGGDVLMLIGDAVLAIYPIDDGRFSKEQACAAALRAARQANARLAEANRLRRAEGRRELAFGIGLHVGSVMYGNIGLPERLEFTATGPAVSETARLEELTKTVGRPIVASQAFAQRVPVEWEPLGTHQLRGLGCCHQVYAAPVVVEPVA